MNKKQSMKITAFIMLQVFIAAGIALGEGGDCLSPRVSIASLQSNSAVRFLQVNKIKINPDKPIPRSITLRNMDNSSAFSLKQIPGSGSDIYHIFLEGRLLANSQVLIRETDNEIKVPSIYLNGSDYGVTRRGMGKTILTYLSLVALAKDKELVIEDTQNYGLMHLCWSCLSSKSRYYPRVYDAVAEEAFEELEWILRADHISVDISSPHSWNGIFELGEGGGFNFIGEAEDMFAGQIDVQLQADRTISVSWRAASEQKQELRYIVQTNISVDKIVISLKNPAQHQQQERIEQAI